MTNTRGEISTANAHRGFHKKCKYLPSVFSKHFESTTMYVSCFDYFISLTCYIQTVLMLSLNSYSDWAALPFSLLLYSCTCVCAYSWFCFIIERTQHSRMLHSPYGCSCYKICFSFVLSLISSRSARTLGNSTHTSLLVTHFTLLFTILLDREMWTLATH